MKLPALNQNHHGLYICLFSDGTIKVGRSSNVKTRLKTIESAGRRFDIHVEKKDHIFCMDHAGAEKKLIDWCASVCSKQYCIEWFKGVNYEECLSMAKLIADYHMGDSIKSNFDVASGMIDRLFARTFTDDVYLASKEKYQASLFSNSEIEKAFDILHYHSEKIRSALGSGVNPPEWFLDLNCENPWEVELWYCDTEHYKFSSLCRDAADAIELIQVASA